MFPSCAELAEGTCKDFGGKPMVARVAGHSGRTLRGNPPRIGGADLGVAEASLLNPMRATVTSIWSAGVLAVIGAAVLLGCATTTARFEQGGTYLSRSVTKTRGAVSVTASVLDQREIAEVFDVRLDLVGIQPVWLKIESLSAYSYVLFLTSIDPDYFSPHEVARRSSVLSTKSARDLYPLMRDLEIQRFITPGAAVEGYVYTHLDEGLKAINVELIGNRSRQALHLAVQVPGLRTDFQDFDPSSIYDGNVPSLDESALRAWLTSQPCCAISAAGAPGDPVNLVLVGEVEDIQAALVSQHWDATAEIEGASIRRMITAFIFGSRYRYAPISALYLFGREQDMSFQKARAVIDERNHIRLWLAPVTHEGTPVFLGHISRDTGIKLSGRFWPPTTHVIDPAVDEARFYIQQDLIHSRQVHKMGFVRGVGVASVEQPRMNAEGDPYFTDGLRAVFFVGNRSTPLAELEALDWSLPAEMEPFRETIFGTALSGGAGGRVVHRWRNGGLRGQGPPAPR